MNIVVGATTRTQILLPLHYITFIFMFETTTEWMHLFVPGMNNYQLAIGKKNRILFKPNIVLRRGFPLLCNVQIKRSV